MNGERMNVLNDSLTDADHVDIQHFCPDPPRPTKTDADTDADRALKRSLYRECMLVECTLLGFMNTAFMSGTTQQERMSEIMGRDELTDIL